MNTVSKTISRIILIFSGITLAGVVILGMILPPHNLLVKQMLPVTVLGFGALLSVCLFFPKNLIKETEKTSRFYCILFFVLLSFFSVLIFVLNIKNPLRTDSLFDYGIITANANNIAAGKPLETPLYYRIALNNFKPTVLLAFLKIITGFLPGSDRGIPLLLIFTLNTTLTVLVTCLWPEGKRIWRYRILLLLLFFFLIPLYVQSGVFYTDNMTFGCAVTVLFFFKKALGFLKAEKKKSIIILLGIAAGILFALGFAVKVTVAIPFIAASVLFILYMISHPEETRKHLKKGLLLLTLPFVLSTFFVSLSLELYCRSFEDYRIAKNTTEPVISYVALGLTGNGSFSDNRDFAYYERYLETKEEKAAYSKEYIKENIGEFVNPSHILKKSTFNFSGGFLGADDFVRYPENENNLFFNLFDAWGKYYWRTSQYCFLYSALIYLFLLTGSIYALFFLPEKEKIPFGILLGNFTFFGLFLFLMIWEANNRQVYNQMPLLLLSVVNTVRMIREFKNQRRKSELPEGIQTE